MGWFSIIKQTPLDPNQTTLDQNFAQPVPNAYERAWGRPAPEGYQEVQQLATPNPPTNVPAPAPQPTPPAEEVAPPESVTPQLPQRVQSILQTGKEAMRTRSSAEGRKTPEEYATGDRAHDIDSIKEDYQRKIKEATDPTEKRRLENEMNQKVTQQTPKQNQPSMSEQAYRDWKQELQLDKPTSYAGSYLSRKGKQIRDWGRRGMDPTTGKLKPGGKTEEELVAEGGKDDRVVPFRPLRASTWGGKAKQIGGRIKDKIVDQVNPDRWVEGAKHIAQGVGGIMGANREDKRQELDRRSNPLAFEEETGIQLPTTVAETNPAKQRKNQRELAELDSDFGTQNAEGEWEGGRIADETDPKKKQTLINEYKRKQNEIQSKGRLSTGIKEAREKELARREELGEDADQSTYQAPSTPPTPKPPTGENQTQSTLDAFTPEQTSEDAEELPAESKEVLRKPDAPQTNWWEQPPSPQTGESDVEEGGDGWFSNVMSDGSQESGAAKAAKEAAKKKKDKPKKTKQTKLGRTGGGTYQSGFGDYHRSMRGRKANS